MLSTPLAVLCYFLIFCVPPLEDGKVVWYLFFYCAFQTLQTVSVPPLDPETSHTLMLFLNANVNRLGKKLLSGSWLHTSGMYFTRH